MKRSIRDAIVGLSILGGIIIFTGSSLWLRGIKIGANQWKIQANFSDASGLSELSPVTFRGILVGSISKIKVNPNNVEATIVINNSSLRLPKPVIAKVITSSLLGGDAQVSLRTMGNSIPQNSPMPASPKCSKSSILCEGDIIKGESLKSISTLSQELEKIIEKADKEDIVSNLVDSTKQFDQTQKNLDELVAQVKEEVRRLEPIITNLQEASSHFNNILASLDNPQTLNDIQQAASSTRSLTGKIDALGTDFSKVIEDKELMSAIRSVTIGLGELFNELYPKKTRLSTP